MSAKHLLLLTSVFITSCGNQARERVPAFYVDGQCELALTPYNCAALEFLIENNTKLPLEKGRTYTLGPAKVSRYEDTFIAIFLNDELKQQGFLDNLEVFSVDTEDIHGNLVTVYVVNNNGEILILYPSGTQFDEVESPIINGVQL